MSYANRIDPKPITSEALVRAIQRHQLDALPGKPTPSYILPPRVYDELKRFGAIDADGNLVLSKLP